MNKHRRAFGKTSMQSVAAWSTGKYPGGPQEFLACGPQRFVGSRVLCKALGWVQN